MRTSGISRLCESPVTVARFESRHAYTWALVTSPANRPAAIAMWDRVLSDRHSQHDLQAIRALRKL